MGGLQRLPVILSLINPPHSDIKQMLQESLGLFELRACLHAYNNCATKIAPWAIA
jgi:hypothetical protein